MDYKLQYLDIELDFSLDPEHFIEWLKTEDDDIHGDYGKDVSTMCKFGCLYIGMLLYNSVLDSELMLHKGTYGIFEHYWIGYRYNGNYYYIDLTLKQFDKSSPKLAIINASENIFGGYQSLESLPLKEWVSEKKGFEFYTNPITMQIPEKAISLKILEKSFQKRLVCW